MRKLFAIAVLLGLASAARSDEKQVEKIYEEAATAGEKLVEALKSIKDEPTAKSALSKVTELDSLLLQSQAFQLARNNVSEQAVKLIAD